MKRGAPGFPLGPLCVSACPRLPGIEVSGGPARPVKPKRGVITKDGRESGPGSAGITGALGVFYAQYVYMIDPDLVFSVTLCAIQPALNGIIGGLGTVWGPVLGAVLMTPLGEFLRSCLGHVRRGLNFFIYGVTW